VKWLHQIPLIVAVLGVLAPCQLVYAAQMTPQYSITVWGHKDGLPSTFVYAIAQTDDGFLWLGTADGLVRFDGVQFASWRSIQPSEAPLGQVGALCVSSHGGLWLGTSAGTLGRIRNDRLQSTSLHSAVESIEEARDGSLWVAGATTLWHLDATNLSLIQPPMALSGNWLSGPLEDDDGTQWITTRQGVFRVDSQNKLTPIDGHLSWLFPAQDGRLALLDESGRVRSPQNEKTIRRSGGVVPQPSTIFGVTAAGDGSLWIALRGNGIMRLTTAGANVSERRFTRNDGISSDFVRVVFEDREHNLWAATEDGLNRLRPNNVLSLTRREGLLNGTVTSIAPARDGSVWLGTLAGLERMAGGKQEVYLQGTGILSLLTSRDGQIWAGTTRGLMQWTNGSMFLQPQDAKFNTITALAEDATGTLWVYDHNEGLFRQQPGQPPEAVTNSELAGKSVTAMYSGQSGEVWFGLDNGDMVTYRGGAYHAYSTRDGLSGGKVHGMSEGTAGGLWVATERGLCLFTGEHFDCRNTQNGLPGNRILWAISDAIGNMWLGYSIGVARLDLRELRDAEVRGAEKLRWKLYDDRDGIESSPDLNGNAPAALAQDGRLWLTTSQGVSVLDPAHLRSNPHPPQVHILEVEADGQQMDLSRRINMPPLTRSIQFSFTGLSLSDPQNVRFRYRLDGFDREWRDGGSRRYASYTNLPPGRYLFRVCAANSDGVWNNTGAALDFNLAPAYFQTLWFRLLCLGVALAGALFLFRVRLLSAQRNMRLRYEERVEERARIAQELHDHLIQEMVGIGMQLEVADALTPGSAGAKSPLERALALSRSAIASGRLTLHSLRSRPMSGTVLLETLRAVVEAYARTDRPPVQYLVDGNERPLGPEIAEDVSEISQEALRNALKHAGNSTIVAHLHYGAASFDLSVRDDGGGIDDSVLRSGAPGHYGIVGMRERAARAQAELTIQSTLGRGTTVHVRVPAIRAYQNDPDANAGAKNRWSTWWPFRRARKEMGK
jgi:signal transduction histidine kinase/ligand-binding sensor domain-containing protein